MIPTGKPASKLLIVNDFVVVRGPDAAITIDIICIHMYTNDSV